VERLAPTGFDELQGALARITGREEGAIPQVWLDRCRELEKNVATQIWDAKVEYQKVEVFRAKQRVSLLARFDGDDVVAGAPEGDRQRTTDRRFIIDYEYTQPLIEPHSSALLGVPAGP
jgi:hypothetical protein